MMLPSTSLHCCNILDTMGLGVCMIRIIRMYSRYASLLHAQLQERILLMFIYSCKFQMSLDHAYHIYLGWQECKAALVLLLI